MSSFLGLRPLGAARRIVWRIAPLAVALAWLPATALAREPQHEKGLRAFAERRSAQSNAQRVSEERSGAIVTREGLSLRLVADQGDVTILTGAHSAQSETLNLKYKVRVAIDARTPNAKEILKQYVLSVHSTPTGVLIQGEMPRRRVLANSAAALSPIHVTYEISVPRNYGLDVLTHSGNIQTQDINGSVSLETRAGAIVAGRVGLDIPRSVSVAAVPSGKLQARLETSGGHLSVADVAGDLRASTGGGHITAGNISGDAFLHSGGGHIRAGNISGKVEVDTDGGNISVQHAGGNVSVTTTGGQIDFGEASGSVRAHTGGGGIRILHVAGPIQLETSDGSICLTRVQGSVRASTGSGTITAWINPSSPELRTSPKAAAVSQPRLIRLSGASQLESGQGDIIVFLPRELAANIEATIEKTADHHIEADPSLALQLVTQGSVGPKGENVIRAQGALNGGGELLRLKTVSGNILLKFFDADPVLHDRLVRQQKNRLERPRRVPDQRFERLLEEGDNEPIAPQAAASDQERRKLSNEAERKAEPDRGLLEDWTRKIEMRIRGGVSVSPEELQQRLVSKVKPAYPDLARRAGIDGTVKLEIQVNKDGTVEVRKALSGQRLLVDAATAAVKQWRYNPVLLGGKPVNAISTVALEFRLR